MTTPSCFLWISLQILVIFDQKNIWHTLLGVVYHVKKVSTIFDENWSHNINLKKKMFHFLKSDMKTHSALYVIQINFIQHHLSGVLRSFLTKKSSSSQDPTYSKLQMWKMSTTCVENMNLTHSCAGTSEHPSLTQGTPDYQNDSEAFRHHLQHHTIAKLSKHTLPCT